MIWIGIILIKFVGSEHQKLANISSRSSTFRNISGGVLNDGEWWGVGGITNDMTGIL